MKSVPMLPPHRCPLREKRVLAYSRSFVFIRGSLILFAVWRLRVKFLGWWGLGSRSVSNPPGQALVLIQIILTILERTQVFDGRRSRSGVRELAPAFFFRRRHLLVKKNTIGSEILEAGTGKRKQACALQSASRPVFPPRCDLRLRQDLLIPRRWSDERMATRPPASPYFFVRGFGREWIYLCLS